MVGSKTMEISNLSLSLSYEYHHPETQWERMKHIVTSILLNENVKEVKKESRVKHLVFDVHVKRGLSHHPIQPTLLLVKKSFLSPIVQQRRETNTLTRSK
jgi:hypothetical protein